MTKVMLLSFSAVISYIASLVGGWTSALTTLCIFMIVDYATAVLLAVIWKKSPKSVNGGLSSSAALQGFIKKGCLLLIVLIAHQLDVISGTTVIKDGVVIFLVVNECVSIVENLGIMGLPIPKAIKNALDVLKDKE